MNCVENVCVFNVGVIIIIIIIDNFWKALIV